MWENLSIITVSTLAFSVVYKIEKKILTYKRYVGNSDQNDSDLLIDHTYAEIIIVSSIDTDFLRRQYDVVVQLARHSPKQLFYYGDVSFGHFSPSNCKYLARLINKFVQSD